MSLTKTAFRDCQTMETSFHDVWYFAMYISTLIIQTPVTFFTSLDDCQTPFTQKSEEYH